MWPSCSDASKMGWPFEDSLFDRAPIRRTRRQRSEPALLCRDGGCGLFGAVVGKVVDGDSRAEADQGRYRASPPLGPMPRKQVDSTPVQSPHCDHRIKGRPFNRVLGAQRPNTVSAFKRSRRSPVSLPAFETVAFPGRPMTLARSDQCPNFRTQIGVGGANAPNSVGPSFAGLLGTNLRPVWTKAAGWNIS